MFLIQPGQQDAFRRIALEAADERLVKHLCRFFPRHQHLLGKSGIRRVVSFGRNRSENHGFLAEREICLYLSLMFMLGSHFDEDPQLPWAGQVLSDAYPQNSFLRINELYDRGTVFSQRIGGNDGEYVHRAMSRMQEVNTTLSSQPRPFFSSRQSEADQFKSYVLSLLHEVYPEKCDELGETLLEVLFHRGLQSCAQYGIADYCDIARYVLFMLLLGSGFDRDPLLPWAGAILEDKSICEPFRKMALLRREGETALERWLSMT